MEKDVYLQRSYKGFPPLIHLVIFVVVCWVQGIWTAMLQTYMNARFVLADPYAQNHQSDPIWFVV